MELPPYQPKLACRAQTLCGVEADVVGTVSRSCSCLLGVLLELNVPLIGLTTMAMSGAR